MNDKVKTVLVTNITKRAVFSSAGPIPPQGIAEIPEADATALLENGWIEKGDKRPKENPERDPGE